MQMTLYEQIIEEENYNTFSFKLHLRLHPQLLRQYI